MSGIAGISSPGKKDLVGLMLKKMGHRGGAWSQTIEDRNTTYGMNGLKIQENALLDLRQNGLAKDGCVPGRFAQAQSNGEGFLLKRDPIGVAPLYYGWTKDGDLCFASEVKALLLATVDIHELQPGHQFSGKNSEAYFQLKKLEPVSESPEKIAAALRQRLENSIEKSVSSDTIGSWLSGGLDSSVMAALARKRVKKLVTFSVGLPEAQDLVYARQMASFIQSEHHELIVTIDEILEVLPDVIYSLETFDALLIRSSVLNFLVGRLASSFVSEVFSGEGGDELFAGYEYIKNLAPESLADELIDIIGRLHNTALQRVDRSASANGTLPHVGFLDPDVVEYALKIPTKYKLYNGIEKWILRQSVSDLLPPQIFNRTKAKFWEGGGFESILAKYANDQISDADFAEERELSNGWRISSKEELLYYRIFKKTYGEANNLDWMGRTKGAPVE